MSLNIPNTASATAPLPAQAAVLFAALGDETRLALLTRLSSGESRSIVELSEDMPLTRQAVTKHLRVLEEAGLVLSSRQGRENHFILRPEPLRDMREYLEQVSRHWDDTLARLKAFVEG